MTWVKTVLGILADKVFSRQGENEKLAEQTIVLALALMTLGETKLVLGIRAQRAQSRMRTNENQSRTPKFYCSNNLVALNQSTANDEMATESVVVIDYYSCECVS